MILLALYFITSVHATWMTIGLLGSSPHIPDIQNDAPPDIPGVCLSLSGLIEQQKSVCTKWPETVTSVPFGTRQGLVECEYQFRNDRWNCTDNRHNNRIQQTIERGSKETAFLYAITSAGVVHTVAKACSSGNLTECSCDRTGQGRDTPEGWKWGGCRSGRR